MSPVISSAASTKEPPERKVAHCATFAINEGGDGGVVRDGITRQRDEGDVLAAGAFYPPAADDALAVGEQDDLEQHSRRPGRGARQVVAVAGVEVGQIQFVVAQRWQSPFCLSLWRATVLQLPFGFSYFWRHMQ